MSEKQIDEQIDILRKLQKISSNGVDVSYLVRRRCSPCDNIAIVLIIYPMIGGKAWSREAG